LCVCSLFLRRGGTVRCIVTGITTASIGIDLKCIDCNEIICVNIILCIKLSWFMTTMKFFLQQKFPDLRHKQDEHIRKPSMEIMKLDITRPDSYTNEGAR